MEYGSRNLTLHTSPPFLSAPTRRTQFAIVMFIELYTTTQSTDIYRQLVSSGVNATASITCETCGSHTSHAIGWFRKHQPNRSAVDTFQWPLDQFVALRIHEPYYYLGMVVVILMRWIKVR